MTDYLRSIYHQTLREMDARLLTQKKLECLKNQGTVDILALGKAASAMSQGALTALGSSAGRGFLITKYSHLGDDPSTLRNFELHESAHPVPDQRGIEAGQALQEWLGQTESAERTLLVLLSGGASSLLVAPAPPLALPDLKEVNQALLRSGLPIEVMNVLRKHLSLVKGGQLTPHCTHYQRIVQLVMVDISAPGLTEAEIFSLVGSGPFSHDPSTIEEARVVLQELKMLLPSEVFDRAEEALRETPKQDRCESTILANHDSLRQTAKGLVASHLLLDTDWPSNIAGEVKAVAREMAAVALNRSLGKNGIFVASGEPTVELSTQPGRGGRCQELALHFAREIAGVSEVALLAGSSDGTDGPTEDAGAVVTGQTWPTLVQQLGLSKLQQMVEQNDCGSALAMLPGALLNTGPTGQNLNDLFLLQVGRIETA